MTAVCFVGTRRSIDSPTVGRQNGREYVKTGMDMGIPQPRLVGSQVGSKI